MSHEKGRRLLGRRTRSCRFLALGHPEHGPQDLLQTGRCRRDQRGGRRIRLDSAQRGLGRDCRFVQFERY